MSAQRQARIEATIGAIPTMIGALLLLFALVSTNAHGKDQPYVLSKRIHGNPTLIYVGKFGDMRSAEQRVRRNGDPLVYGPDHDFVLVHGSDEWTYNFTFSNFTGCCQDAVPKHQPKRRRDMQRQDHGRS